MTEISVDLVVEDDEIEAVQALCQDWLDWHWKAYPDDWPTEGNPMDPQRFQKILEDLPGLHARPRGGIFLARLDGEPVGCVMYNEADGMTAELNRLFVRENGRGHGLGRMMLERMFEQMKSDGYKRAIFSSAKFLTHAKEMYQDAGFVDMPHPQAFPEAWREYVYFMERRLDPSE
ncbi:GNAT family N-acetyltransferase [Sulfitobacter sp. F26204]|uniref:GNAT family N-acetyltransferase n=1 Tax=Sulfitobacter sp. F26204 TaxID=2996014 RepID=UPI00225E11E9|nr:GNAT family N-acetyltransferase [Sulfitobacter sp. F26204]MCX7558506.1 GNAT family N-acetyltransferase [Sulfitobacter sp. F26204]